MVAQANNASSSSAVVDPKADGIIGERVVIQWARGKSKSYAGAVSEQDSGNRKHLVQYDGGSKKW